MGPVEALDNARLACRSSGLPLEAELEDGPGPTPSDGVRTVEAGAARIAIVWRLDGRR